MPDQIDLLLGKGLVIGDRSLAETFLNHVSYFRFKEYSWTFKDYKEADGNYHKGTTFEQVRDLYYFDRRLKLLLFEAIESIEIAVKTQLSNIMSLRHGIHWYLDDAHFFSEAEKKKIREREGEDFKWFDHSAFLADLEEELEDPEEISLKYYKKSYEPKHPPSWMVMEMISFGTLSKMIANLQPSDEKTAICESFRLTKLQLVSWLHCFAFLRNRCAHHARLVHNNVRFAPAMPRKASRIFLTEHAEVEDNSIYAACACMQFMLQTCNPQACFGANLKALFDQFPTVRASDLGFTANWRKEALWRGSEGL